jgi:hypothetical protein
MKSKAICGALIIRGFLNPAAHHNSASSPSLPPAEKQQFRVAGFSHRKSFALLPR